MRFRRRGRAGRRSFRRRGGFRFRRRGFGRRRFGRRRMVRKMRVGYRM